MKQCLLLLIFLFSLSVAGDSTSVVPFSPDIYDSLADSLESQSSQTVDTLEIQQDTTQDQPEPEPEPEQRPKRVFTTVGFGPAGFINLGSSNLAYSTHYGGVLKINPFVNGRLIGEITTDFTDAFIGDVELGVDIFTGEGFFAPYFGAGFSGGFARGLSENVFGMGVSGNLGVYLFKNAPFQINLQGRFYALFSEIETNYPMYYGFRVGLLF